MEGIHTCKLCYEAFGDKLRPRVLPCGHSYCTNCLDKLFKNYNISCPKCKKNHQVSSARDFSINYDFEESLLDARNASTKVPIMQTLIDEQKPRIQNLIFSAEDMQSQLKRYDEFLLNKKGKHEALLQKIRELGSLHESLVKEIEEERIRIMDFQKKGDEYCKVVNDKLSNLNTSADKAAGFALTQVFECLGKLTEWIDQCKKFPYPNIAVSQQILTKSMDAFALVSFKTNEKVPGASGLLNNHLRIMEKLTEINDQSLALDKLSLESKLWRKRIAAGQVYAIDSSNGRKRSAVLSERDGKIYLHYLQDREAPVLAYTIEHTEVVKSLNKESTVVFMDLAWNGSFKGRVHILLSPDTPLARHFKMLCTGDLGPSYAHSKIFSYCKKGVHECIIGGDYEYNDGRGGASVMEGINKNDDNYIRQGEQGVLLVPGYARESQCSQFVIIISSYSNKVKRMFGKVQDGIGVLKAAASFIDITKVEVINCGVQLPLRNYIFHPKY